jgi:CRISPR-associated endonuclease/helicase Cas3
VFRAATGHAPYDYQRRLATGGQWPAIVRVPTGAGKTAAVVMAWLWRAVFAAPEVARETPRRLVYCLPQRSLVRQTAAAIAEWLARLGLQDEVPLHVLMGGELSDGWDADPERRQILVGTQDQLLSRALNRGYGMSRYRWPMHFALLNNDSLWVIDEPQLFGNGLATTAQLQAMRRLFGTYGPAHTLWVSATIRPEWLATVDHAEEAACCTVLELSDADRQQLASRLQAKKPLRFSGLTLSVKDAKTPAAYIKNLADYVQANRAQGALTLVIVNRVARAQQLAQVLTKDRAAPVVRLVHSRFRPADRRQLDTELASLGRQDAILVATQAVEAGLDLSAEVLITELAPWASLVQRFGRCNRDGLAGSPAVYWIDVESDEIASKPYDPEQLSAARSRLKALTDVGPAHLPPENDEVVHSHVLRRRDLLALFDTSADLTGADIDVSPYVRDADDTDVQVWWRTWTGERPPADLRRPHHDEVCRVSLAMIRDYLTAKSKHGRRSAWTWDPLTGKWAEVQADRVVPGQLLLLDARLGGYTPQLGFDPGSWDPVPEFEVHDGPPFEAHDAEDDNVPDNGSVVELGKHLVDVWRHAAALRQRLGDVDGLSPVLDAVAEAALHHDRGKAHPLFQARLKGPVSPDSVAEAAPASERDHASVGQMGSSASAEGPDDTAQYIPVTKRDAVRAEDVIRHPLLAKGYRRETDRGVVVSIGGERRSSRGFRHELASALAYLADQPPARRNDPAVRLVAYLIAAHHGKVRMHIQSVATETLPADDRLFARGVWQGDQLPAVPLPDGGQLPRVTLDLSVMQLGAQVVHGVTVDSWVMGVVRLLEELGPFRLAYLETLVRVADWRASREEVQGHA